MTAAAALAGCLALSRFPFSSFEMLAEIFVKNHQFSSEYLNPSNSVSIRHPVCNIFSVFKQKQTKSLEKNKIIWFTFFSDQLYTENDRGKKENIKT